MDMSISFIVFLIFFISFKFLKINRIRKNFEIGEDREEFELGLG